ncbi:hypothetical protein APR12_000778 [Nocardia amikacinitolerans]|nr:hypothetical protein [Nocardia amikacinitolerans]
MLATSSVVYQVIPASSTTSADIGRSSLRCLLNCRSVLRPWRAGREQAVGVLGSPSGSLGDGRHDQVVSGWCGWVAGLYRCDPQVGGVGFGDADRGEGCRTNSARSALWSGRVLARPAARDQDAAAGQSEGVAAVGFALAAAGYGLVAGALGDDAVAQPHRAPRRARNMPQRGMQRVVMCCCGNDFRLHHFPNRFRQVLGQIADMTIGLRVPARIPLESTCAPKRTT